MTKSRIWLYCDTEKSREIDNLGINHSDLHEFIMDLVLSEELYDYTYEYQIHTIKELIAKQIMIVRKGEEYLEAQQIELERLKARLKELQTEYEEFDATLELGKYIGRLNRVVVTSEYDPAAVYESAKTLVEKIKDINPNFDLVSHCKLLKSFY